MSRPRRAALFFVFITVVLDVLALGVIIPVLPKLIEQVVGGDTAHAALIYGGFAMSFALMQFLFSPLTGALSDQFGRRPIILMSNLGLALDYLLFAFANTLPVLLLARLIGGITASSISTAFAYVADVTTGPDRAKGYGLLGAGFGLGFVIGPALGGVLGGIDLKLPFYVAGALSLCNFCYGYFILPESLPKEKRKRVSLRRANPIGSLLFLRRQTGLLALASVSFLSSLAHMSLPAVFVLYAGYRYQWDPTAVGLALALVGVCSAIVQGGLMGPATKRFGERRLLLFGLAMGALGFAAYGLAPSGVTFLIAVPLMALWGFAGPSLQALMTQRIDPSEQGSLQGAIQSLAGLTGIIGPVLYTQVFAYTITGSAATHPFWSGAAFFLAAASLGIGFWIAQQRAHHVGVPVKPAVQSA